jgi:hypothetical protein
MAYQLTDQDRAMAQQMAGKLFSDYNQVPQAPKPQVNGLTGFLANAAPIIGGTLGAVGGSFLAPVAGTAAGGAAGAGLGAIVKQKLLGQDTNVGDIASETLLGALPGAGKLIKGVAGAGRAVKGAEDVAQAVETATPSSIFQRAGQRLTESGSGLKPDLTTGGINKLDQQSQFMSKYTGTPRQQRIAMEKDMGNLSGQVDSILAKNPIPIQGADVKAQVQQAISDPLKYAELDLTTPGAQRALNVHLDKFAASPDAKSLNDYIKQLNPIAIRAQGKIARGVNLTDKETAALAAKKAGDEVLTQVPEIQPLKQQMAQIFEVTPQIAKAGEKSIGVPMASGLSTKAPVQAAKGVQSKLGALLQGASAKGKVNPDSLAMAFRPSNLLKAGVKQGIAQSLANTQQPPETPIPDQGFPDIIQPALSEDSGALTSNIWSDPQAVQDAYTKAIAAGDAKSASAILEGYKAFGQQSAANPGFTKPTAQQFGLAQAGISSLGQLEQLINKDPSLVTRESTPGQGLPIVGGLISNVAGTGEYNSVANNILDALARVRTGAAMTSQEESFYRNLLPKAGDDQATIQSKLAALKQAFTPFMGYGGADNSPDLSSLINQ